MNMYIIMYMNIYITKDNEQALREYKGSMSGLVNTLLDGYRQQIKQGYGTLAEYGDKVTVTDTVVLEPTYTELEETA